MAQSELYSPNTWREESDDTVTAIMARIMPPHRREGPVQFDPIWREARELGVENEYGSMLNPTWDSRPMPEPRDGTWAHTPDHYFRFLSPQELQSRWNRPRANDQLELSPEPSQRDIGECLMNTPDCNCRWVLFDSFQNPPESGRLSYDQNEADLAMSPSTNRPPGYVCAGRYAYKHIRIRSACLQGFVIPLTRYSNEGSNRTFFEPEGESSQAPGPVAETMVQDDDGEFDDALSALELLSGQTFAPRVERQEIDWNAEPEPPEANLAEDQIENVGQVIEMDLADMYPQLRKPRPGQNRVPYVDPLEAWRSIRNEYSSVNTQSPAEADDCWEALRNLREEYYSPLEEPKPQTPAQDEDERMQDPIAPELLDYDEEVGGAGNWAPQSGDVIILKRCRYQIPWPGFDGKVEIYTDENEHDISRNPMDSWTCWFEEGDVVVRFGSYSQNWKWTQAPQVRVYQWREGKVFLVARQIMQPLYPLEYKFVDPREKFPHHMDFRFKPRYGDLIINRGIQFPFVWYVYWWDEGMPVRPSDLLLRAAYDEDANLSSCDAELYLRNPNPDFPDKWIFLGKDDFCFTKTDQCMFNDNQ